MIACLLSPRQLKSTYSQSMEGIPRRTTLSKMFEERHHVLLLCVACAFISISDRVNISIAVLAMAKSLHWDAMTQSLVLSCFFWGYTVSQPFAPHVIKMFGARSTLSLAVSAWSLMTMITPICANASLRMMVCARVLMGVAEGFTYPVAFSFNPPG